MSQFPTILLPLDGSVTAARSLGCATWLATRLGARLHVLSATDRPLPAREELERLQVAEQYWPTIELHQAPEFPETAILAAVAHHDVRLVVMTARGAALEEPATRAEAAKLVGHVTRVVIERSAAPVLLLPAAYREELPWERLVVPLSGEVMGDEALGLAARLAAALDVTVRVVHVVGVKPEDETLETRMRYSDALHHEYSAQLDELVDRVLPSLAPSERARIHGTSLRHGVVVDELLAQTERQPASVLVIGWHGRFMSGRAPVLKALLPVVHCPVLLVRSAVPPLFRLKVGEDFG